MTDRPEGDPAEAADQAPGEPIPLTRAPVGQEVELAAVHGGRHLLHRLAEMGLTRGTRFRIMNRGRAGPIIISVGDTRLMLGRGMVHRIMVRPVGG
jgi:ferrous iron transport protein A